MNDIQRDPRLNEMLFPSYTNKRAMEIFTLHDPNPENHQKSMYH